MALASKASYGHAHNGHAHKDLVPFRIPEGQFLIDRWMHMQKSRKHVKIIVGMAIKRGRGNVKGSDTSPPPLCTRTYSLSNSTRKEASVKKIAFLSQTLQKFVNSFFKFKKKLISGLLWLSLKPSLRSGFKANPFEPRKILFLCYEKRIYSFWSVFYKKNTISRNQICLDEHVSKLEV